MSYKELLSAVINGTLEDLSAPLSAEERSALVTRAASDVGAPFEQEMLARIRATKEASPADYIRLREALKANKVKVGDLDKLIDKAEKKTSDSGAGQGRAITFPVIEPWHELVDGDALLTEIVSQVQRYVMISEAAAVSVGLWIMHAYCFECFAHSPRLAILSPEKRCGKTTLLNLVQTMVPRALSASNITPPAMFRAIEKFEPSLLIDEADTFLKHSEELRGIINSGHARGGSVLRLVGDEHEPAAFSTYCPTAIAAIGSLPGTIEDRAFKIVMRRRLSSETIERVRDDKSGRLETLKRMIARWIYDNKRRLYDADPDMPRILNDRACDNWRGALAIADLIGAGWPARSRAAAIEVSGDDPDEQSAGVMLLTDIERVFGDTNADRIGSTSLVDALCALVDRPWSTWNRGKQITSARVAKMLKEFRIYPGTIKLRDGSQPNGYKRAQFKDAFGRYLTPTAENASESSPASPTSTITDACEVKEAPHRSSVWGASKVSQPIDCTRHGEAGEVNRSVFASFLDNPHPSAAFICLEPNII